MHTLLHLYGSLVRSKFDYGSVVYGSTRESYLRMLDPIQNHALRLCLGASELHLPQVCVFKPMNLHSTYGEECRVYSIPSDLAHPLAIQLTIRSSAQNSKRPVTSYISCQGISHGLPPTRQTTYAQRMARNMELL